MSEEFLDYLKDVHLVLEDPRVSDCRHCYHFREFGAKDKECPNREKSDIQLNEWSYAYATYTGMDKEKNVQVHCLSWLLDSPESKEAAIEIAIERKRPTLAEVEHEPVFENLLPEDNFISRYFTLATGMNDSYPEYHFMCATVIIASLIQRKIILEMANDYYPNVYAILVGKSTKTRKTTALNFMRKIIGGSVHFFPDEFSGPAIFDELSERGQGLFWIDEYGDFLAKMSHDYNAGMPSFLCKIYDCPEIRRKRLRRETFIINNAYPNIIGGIQPSVLSSYTTETDLATGYPVRTLWLNPTRPKETKPIRQKTNEEKRAMIELHQVVKNYGVLFSGGLRTISIKMSQETEDKYNEWIQTFENILNNDPYEELLDSQIGRLQDYALKLAMIFTIADPHVYSFMAQQNHIREKYEKFSDEEQEEMLKSAIGDSTTEYNNCNTLLIPEKYLDIAIFYIEKVFLFHARKTAIRICADQQAFILDRVYEIILKKQGIDRAALTRRSRLKKRDLDEVIETLIEGERIKTEIEQIGQRKKIRTKYYAIKTEEEEKDEKK